MIRFMPLMLVVLMAIQAQASPEIEKLLAQPRQHPYLFFTSQDIPALRLKAEQEPTAQAARLIIHSAALSLKAELPVEPPPGPDSPFDAQGAYTAEYLKIHYDFYDAGYAINDIVPTLAMAYLLTGEREYADRAKQWLLHYAGWNQWSVKTALADNQSAHSYLGLAVGYDWLYDELAPQERVAVRDALRRLGETFETHRGALAQEPLAGNRGGIANNHTWVSHSAPAVGALAQLYEQPAAKQWLETQLVCWRDKIIPASIGRDGEYVDGPGWFSYCLQYGTLVLNAWRHNGLDIYGGSRLDRVADYVLRARGLLAEGASLPPYDVRHAFLELASRYKDPTAQWAALDNGLKVSGRSSRRWSGIPGAPTPYPYQADAWNHYRLEWNAETGHFRTLIDGRLQEDMPLVEGTWSHINGFGFMGHAKTIGTFEVRNLRAMDADNHVLFSLDEQTIGPLQDATLTQDHVLRLVDQSPEQLSAVRFPLPTLKSGAIEFEARKGDNNVSYFYFRTFIDDRDLRGLIWYNDGNIRKHMPDYRNQDWPFGWHPDADLWYPAVFEFLFHDASVKPERPTSPAASWVFADLGEVHLRTSWSAEAVSLVFRSGPEIGKDHGDNNAFRLRAFGEDILGDLVTPPSGEKELTQKQYDLYAWFEGTEAHNTILPGNHTQPAVWGDQTGRRYSAAWLAAPEENVVQRGRLTDVLLSALCDVACGEAAAAYTRKQPVLTRFRRELVFVKPDYFIVYDDLASAAESLLYKWLLHSRFSLAVRDGRMHVAGPKSQVLATPLWPEQPVIDVLDTPAPLEKDRTQYFALHGPEPTKQQRFCVVLQPSRAGQEPAALAPKLTPIGGAMAVDLTCGGLLDHHLFAAAEQACVSGEGWELEGTGAFVRSDAGGAPQAFMLRQGRRLAWREPLVRAEVMVSAAVAMADGKLEVHGHGEAGGKLMLRAPGLKTVRLADVETPARYEADGLLALQVPPGTWHITGQ